MIQYLDLDAIEVRQNQIENKLRKYRNIYDGPLAYVVVE
jgi:hypothetical protein